MMLQPLGTEDPESGWKGAKAMLADARLLRAMHEYRRENLSEEQLRRVGEFLASQERLAGENLKMASKAAYGLLEWVRAVVANTPLPSRHAAARRRPLSVEDTKWARLRSGDPKTYRPLHSMPWRPPASLPTGLGHQGRA